MVERASMEIRSTITDDIAQAGIAPHDVDLGVIGLVRVHHADAINVGLAEEGDADPRISILIALQGCQCGCASRGRALLITPSPQHAREIGQSLIDHAAEMERRAKASADTWLTKIAKGSQA